MGIKIHDPATDDIPVSVPEGWPTINVGEFQKNKSLGKEVDAERLKDILTLAVKEISDDYDTTVLVLPLDETQTINFRFAVYDLAFSKLLPGLPVNNQHDSISTDPEALERTTALLQRNAVAFQKTIPGYKSKPVVGSVYF